METVVLLCGILAGAGVTYLAGVAFARDLKDRTAARLEAAKTSLLAWSMSATRAGDYHQAGVLQDAAQHLADEAERVRKL